MHADAVAVFANTEILASGEHGGLAEADEGDLDAPFEACVVSNFVHYLIIFFSQELQT